MIILVGVTVSVVMQGGLFDKAKTATELTERAEIHEQIMGEMKVTNKGKIKIEETYEAAVEMLSPGYDVGELKEDGTFKVTGKRGTYKYKITEAEITTQETTIRLTLNSNGDSIFTEEYMEMFQSYSSNPVPTAKLVYKSEGKTIIISNTRHDTLLSTMLILVKYYEGEELKKSFTLRGPSACFNDNGSSTGSNSVYDHYPKGWTDFRVSYTCNSCLNGSAFTHNVYGVLPESEYPQFSGEWEIDTENSNDYGLKYLSNVLITDERGEIKDPEVENPEVTDPDDGTDTGETDATAILSEGATINGEAPSSTNPFIPAGFKAVNTSASWNATSTPDTENGLVIEDANKNQFVWVPVSNINEMAMCKTCGSSANSLNTQTAQCMNCGENTILIGKLYNGSTVIEYSDSGSREPVALTSAGETTDQQTQYENNYKAMVESVAKYGGFYIGRYETSASSTGIAQSKKSTSDNVIVSANASTNGSWAGLYSLQRTYTTDSVQSEMIWGSQYDAMVRWLGTTATIDEHNQTRNPGTASGDVIKNIYDIYGNSYEWTQESYGTNLKPTRSGSCTGGASGNGKMAINYRCTMNSSFAGITSTFERNGSRMTLYIIEEAE